MGIPNMDLAQVVLYVFWLFFAGLIFYLHRENKREGYPLQSDRSNERVSIVGFPEPPPSKTFHLPHGGTVTVPEDRVDRRAVAAVPVAPWPGAPLTPTGNPMLDGVGPGAWAERLDEPDLTVDGDPKIVPLRVATDYYPAPQDPDPRGMTVVGGDRKVAGTIVDAWVDRSEFIFRYYEAELTGSGRRVLIPVNFAAIDGRRRSVRVDAIFAAQFQSVPALRNADQVTFLEEEKICAYFGGGLLYAEPKRTESWL
ncbi:photosynthetic reaction center subunit H [Prosthecomicrobium hirschii]|uniref:photosynthetic reaction center subunit H n=1 Tax=Prosthecodimorpha hirschii TaxID=665126 RepID=UPI0011289D4C|nr:photosynthetic reaction center subunit H [Prosthecomicrobium hirschii]MCW1842489.1 photosynthetic reaction center subunit H [Prosthecomicrobium hirschii]TPQ48059.1 photosynthetic reaction center subunit H [Prosthecomicrobium hirschii]